MNALYHDGLCVGGALINTVSGLPGNGFPGLKARAQRRNLLELNLRSEKDWVTVQIRAGPTSEKQ